MVVLYKERLTDVVEVILDKISGYYEVYKNKILISVSQEMIDAQAIFNII